MQEYHNVDWLRRFRKERDVPAALAELRREIFAGTREIVERGSYTTDKRTVFLPRERRGTVWHDDPPPLVPKDGPRTKFAIIEADCLQSANLLIKTGMRPCVLSMANARTLKEDFLAGGDSQEEDLLRRTDLYVSLFQFAPQSVLPGDVRRREEYTGAHGEDGGFYSPGVSVFRSTERSGYSLLRVPYQVDIVSVSAIRDPVVECIDDTCFIAGSHIAHTKDRIRTILRIAGFHGHECLVLSALGCGHQRNPAAHIAELFRDVFMEEEFLNWFNLVVFAILDIDHYSGNKYNPEGNFLPFHRTFQGI
ncbi:MAG: TIGR02452 family protein [Desulfovibrio sp.]|jgi:uncharacterized protein (TIGR02452 family)|nr:TIGR02452 family protein [Desulfovibrio sp.]